MAAETQQDEPQADAPASITEDDMIEQLSGADLGDEQADTPAPVADDDDAAIAAVADEPPGEDTPKAVDPPPFWTADEKAAWAELTPRAQQIVLEREKARDADHSRRVNEVAAERKAADEAKAKVAAERDAVAAWVQSIAPQVEATLRGKWAGVTDEHWTALAAADPSKYTTLRAEYDADVRKLATVQQAAHQELTAAQARAAEALDRARNEGHAKLAADMPQYFGGDKAEGTYKAIGEYLSKQGVAPERIRAIVEPEVIAIAHKAMLYDRSVAALAAKRAEATKGAAAKPVLTVVQPGATPRPTNTAIAARREAMERHRQTGSMASFVDALKAL